MYGELDARVGRRGSVSICSGSGWREVVSYCEYDADEAGCEVVAIGGVCSGSEGEFCGVTHEQG